VEFRIDPPAQGLENMRRDAAMLEAGVPAVRVYAWRPAAVSLGYAQPESVVDAEAARALGVDVVRRPTGGGALLHEEDEVTYAIVVPRAWLSGDVAASYRRLSAPVVRALRALGVPAGFVEGRGGRDALCYLRQEGISIGVDGRKISGGAQKRTRNAVLQHGTVLVGRSPDRMARFLGGSSEAIAARTTCVAEFAPEAHRTRVAAAVLNEFKTFWSTRVETVA
jgi:lipoate-protein ligase A